MTEGHVTAGGLLRAAREKQGLHVAALAAAVKVTPRKLEALEADRYDELPDVTFARGLAKTVCRVLKTDPAPVLALLPPIAPDGAALTRVSNGLATPFHERPGRFDPPEWAVLQRPLVWGAGFVLLAALIVYLLPPDFALPRLSGLSPDAGPAASAPAVAGAPASVVIETVHSVPATEMPVVPPTAAPVPVAEPTAVAAAPASAPPPPAAGVLVLRATGESWVEVRDAGGQVLVSRTLQVGETIGLDGAVPLKLKIGNALGTQVTFRGEPVALNTRDNVARLELR